MTPKQLFDTDLLLLEQYEKRRICQSASNERTLCTFQRCLSLTEFCKQK